MNFWDWMLMYVGAGIGVAEGFRAFRRRYDQRWTRKAWLLSASFWWVWIMFIVIVTSVSYYRRK